LTDGNRVYVSAENSVGSPGAGPVGDTLWVDAANATDLRLGWDAVPQATSYDISRSSMADGGFAVVSQSATPTYDDPGALVDGQSWFYLVTTTSSCQAEASE
jgi:hypothetical protein